MMSEERAYHLEHFLTPDSLEIGLVIGSNVHSFTFRHPPTSRDGGFLWLPYPFSSLGVVRVV